MLIPPEGYAREGWKVWTVGDDICWMRPGADGRLYAIKKEEGGGGGAKGKREENNQNARTRKGNENIGKKVAVKADKKKGWEGRREEENKSESQSLMRSWKAVGGVKKKKKKKKSV